MNGLRGGVRLGREGGGRGGDLNRWGGGEMPYTFGKQIGQKENIERILKPFSIPLLL